MIKYVQYTKEQRRNSKVTGYSLYVNSNHCCTYESLHDIKSELSRYQESNDIEIYQVLQRR